MAAFDASLRSAPRPLRAGVIGPRPRSDAALVTAARRGSPEAWNALFERHWPTAFRTAYLVVHDAAAAEDIAQEAFLAALQALDRFDRRRPFAPWLHRIVVNRAIVLTRTPAHRRETASEHAGDDLATHVPEAPDEPTLAALRALSPDHRVVVVLRFVLDWTPGEIATALDLPRGTVNSRLRRALDALAAQLEEGQAG